MTSNRWAWLFFGLALLVAAGLRFSHLDWDGLNHTHPDERGLLFVASDLRLPRSTRDWLPPQNASLNPLRLPGSGEERVYTYGHWPLYAMRLAAPIMSPVWHAAYPAPFDRLTLAGRALSALYDTLTVLVAGLLARKLYGAWAGTLAAWLVALAAMHIQQAHFATVDTALALCCTLALWLMVEARAGAVRPLWVGLCVGLAAGAKASAGLLVVPLVVTFVQPASDARPGGRVRVDARLWLALLAATLAFAFTNPYAVLEIGRFARIVGTQAGLLRGQLDAPFTRQYVGTLPVWYFVLQQARFGLGVPLTLAGYAGLGRATRQVWQREDKRLAPLVFWAWAMLVVTGTQFVKFPRYMLPVMPILCVLAAGMVVKLPQRPRIAAITLVLASSLTSAASLMGMYGQAHPWQAASQWLYAELPPGATLAIEQADDALPLDLTHEDGVRLAAQTFNQRPFDPYIETKSQLNAALQILSESDYVVVSTNRAYGVVPRLEATYPAGAAFYRSLFAGELGFQLEQVFCRYPALFGVAFVDDTFTRPGLPRPQGLDESLPVPRVNVGYLDESFTVYDHPLVLVFRNEEGLSIEQMRSSLP